MEIEYENIKNVKKISLEKEGNKIRELQKTVNTKVLRPSGTGFEWCVNQYHGCSHGCLYCYGMTVRKMTYADWVHPKPRKDVVENLRKDIQHLKKCDLLGSVKDIFVGSVTDSYQPLELEHGLTRQIIEVLEENQLPFTILTKGSAILRDIDLLKDYPFCRAGVTLISLNENVRRNLEPGASKFQSRIEVLNSLKENGISTYLSCEPIMPVLESDPIQIVEYSQHFVDLYEFGMWSKYRYKHIPKYFWENYSDEYYVDLFTKLLPYLDNAGVNFCIASHSKKFFEKYGLSSKPHLMIKR